MWTNFAATGEPGFAVPAWNKQDKWYASLADTVTIQQDYATQYNVAKQEAHPDNE